MTTAVKTKASMAGAKRKAETIKEGPSKGSKKPKIDSIQNIEPRIERNGPEKKTNAVAKRLISGALGISALKNSQSLAMKGSNGEKGAKVPKTKNPIVKQVSVQARADLSDNDSDSSDEDGGVVLGGSEGSDEAEESLPTMEQGVHPDRVKANGNAAGPNGTSSRESHVKQKQLIAERKASKPLAEQLARTKKIWERLRRKSHVPLEERKKLVEELFEIITGKVKDYVLKHDSVRVVQTAIKYANLEQKRLIARELQGAYRQLAESRYAKFLIGKLLVQGDDEVRDIVVPEFFGNVRRLIKHPEASWILDDVYRGVATGQQKATILREWYGAEFALFQKDKKEKISGDLASILAIESGKRGPIMRSLQELINHLIQKKMTAFTLLHDAMLQYFLNCKPGTEEITDFIELLKGDEEGDLLKNLAFTKSGARVVCLALAHGTAKDRKHILKTYKDTFQMMAADQNGHIIILTAYEVIDDTVLTAKSIFPELLGKDPKKQAENATLCANELVTRVTLLYLFQGRSTSLFPASLSSDLAILSEIDSIRTNTSKKDPQVRRQELTKALSPYLLTAITPAAPSFVTTSFGCQFVTEVLFSADGDKSPALKAIASTAAGNPVPPNPETPKPAAEAEDGDKDENGDEDEDAINNHDETPLVQQQHIAQTPHGGKMLKALISGGRYDPQAKKITPVSPPLNFADLLYPIIKPHVVAWATGASSFVVLNLLETEDFSPASRTELMGLLKAEKKALLGAAMEDGMAGREEADVAVGTADVADAGAREQQGKGKGKGGKGKGKGGKGVKKPGSRSGGNQGTRMILEVLDRDV